MNNGKMKNFKDGLKVNQDYFRKEKLGNRKPKPFFNKNFAEYFFEKTL